MVIGMARDHALETPTQRKLLKDEAYDTLKARILDEVYKPESFLSERRLSEELNYGKSPVRHAVQRLHTEGFVTISPQQGIMVKALSFEDITEHFEIRIALERHIVRRLAGNLTPEQVAQLGDFLDLQKDLLDDCEPSDAARLNANFHKRLCDFLGNRQITKVMEHQYDMLYRVIKRIYQRQPERRYQSHRDHREIAAAITRGDETGAIALVERHIEESKRFLISL